ncbi:hypothetical protein GCM10010340_57880 [Streptomyces griseoloalbus]|nr:hypothetical protein GCM10010340_57880 [Streptomyces albaduncus]
MPDMVDPLRRRAAFINLRRGRGAASVTPRPSGRGCADGSSTRPSPRVAWPESGRGSGAARPADAHEPLARRTDWAHDATQPWIDAHVRRCRALLAPEADAAELYQDAPRPHPEVRQFERARTAPLHGEWLRRKGPTPAAPSVPARLRGVWEG